MNNAELAQIAGDGTTIDTAKVDSARLGAYNFIASYLGARYELPITSDVPVLKDCEADIARFYLYDDNPTDTVLMRFEHWKSWLKSVGEGKIQLFDRDDKAVPKRGDTTTGSDGFFTVTGASKVFTENVMSQIDISRSE